MSSCKMALLVVIPIFQLSVHLASNGCYQHLQVLNIPKPNACPVFNVPCTSASTTEFDAVAYEDVKQRGLPCLIPESSEPWDSTSHSSSICCRLPLEERSLALCFMRLRNIGCDVVELLLTHPEIVIAFHLKDGGLNEVLNSCGHNGPSFLGLHLDYKMMGLRYVGFALEADWMINSVDKLNYSQIVTFNLKKKNNFFRKCGP